MAISLKYSVDTNSTGKTTTVVFLCENEHTGFTPVQTKLNSLLFKKRFVRIDLAYCEMVDSQHLYYLLSLVKALNIREKEYEVVRLSKKFIEAIVLLGIPMHLFKIELEKEN